MIELLRLGIRFARVRRSGRWLTTALTALATAAATAVVIAALAAPTVIAERQQRAEGRVPRSGSTSAAQVRYEDNIVYLEDQRVTVVKIARDRGAPLPPGVTEPDGGTGWFVAPALRDWAQNSATAAQAFSFVGTSADIDSATLEDRSDLLAYHVVPLAAASDIAQPVSGFGAPIPERGGVTWVRGLSAVVFVALPLVAVLWTAARLSSRRKDTRLRSLRILGLNRWNLSVVAATEVAVVSGVGSGLAAIAVWATRPHLDRFAVNGATLAPDDVALISAVPIAIVAVTVAATGIAVASSWVQLRFGAATPRAWTNVVPRSAWLLVAALLAGLVFVLGWTSVVSTQNQRLSLLQPAIPLLGVSLAAGLAGLQRRAASAAADVGGMGAPWQSAFRRLASDSAGAVRPARILCVSTFVLVVTTVLLSSFWVDLGWAAEYRRVDGLALVTVDPRTNASTWAPAYDDGIVRAHVPLVENEEGSQVLVASCAQLDVLNADELTGCDEAPRLLRVAKPEDIGATPSDSTLPPLLIRNPDELTFDGMERIDPSDRVTVGSFDELALVYVVVERSALDTFKAREYARNPFAVIQASSFDLLDVAPDPGGRWIVAGGLVAMGLGVLGAGIACIERALSMREGDRRFAVVGASQRQRRRRRLIELLAPLLPGCALGTGAGLLAATAYRRVADSGTVNVGRILLVAGIALAGAVLLVLMAAPLSRSETITTLGSRRD